MRLFWFFLESTNITSLLDLSQEYSIQTIKDRCEAFMLLDIPTVALLVTAQDYALPKLLKKCIKHFSSKASVKVEEDPYFSKLSEENQMLLLKKQRSALQDFSLQIESILKKHR